MTKEEILNSDWFENRIKDYNDYLKSLSKYDEDFHIEKQRHESVISELEVIFTKFKELEIYAQQESDKNAVEFLNWVNKNYSHYNDNLYSNLEDAELHTTTELLNIFKQQ